MPVLIAGEDDTIITGQNGIAIAGNVATTNSDTQEFDFYINIMKALLWQYNDAPALQSIVTNKQKWLICNHTKFWNDWINNVFNLTTADDFGLSVWSIILDLPLYVNEGATPAGVLSFGFSANNGNFNNSNFGNLNGQTVNLPTATKRIALQLRYFQLVSSGTVPEINRFLKFLFGNMGTSFLVDNHNMTQQYIFFFPLTWDLQYLFNNFDILPRPAGVKSTYRDGTQNTFGFSAARLNFGNGNFGG